MKRLIPLALLAFTTGCSNAPVAGFLDNCFPSRAVRQGPPAGGVPGGVVPDVRPIGPATTELPPPRNP